MKTILAVLILFSCLSYAQRNTVIVRPKPIDEVLQNPNMGITTFNRFNGQATNPPLKWSEIGPVEKVQQATSKPDFPDTTIAYLRWYWNALEPERGKYRWDIIDLALQEARAHGQTLAIRLMPYSNQDPLPSWYESTGARRANKSTDKDGKIWQPDFSDPIYLKLWGELVAEAGKRYNGNPNL
ncbi:MAG TPA: beta-galactosidase, partial [Terriglobales bacterium]|nr:beta-galactosidase [Terriglobales bacterium]